MQESTLEDGPDMPRLNLHLGLRDGVHDSIGSRLTGDLGKTSALQVQRPTLTCSLPPRVVLCFKEQLQ